jgi:hypothetical protein
LDDSGSGTSNGEGDSGCVSGAEEPDRGGSGKLDDTGTLPDQHLPIRRCKHLANARKIAIFPEFYAVQTVDNEHMF